MFATGQYNLTVVGAANTQFHLTATVQPLEVEEPEVADVAVKPNLTGAL